MPNWCNNSITISGSTDTIKQLWEDAHTYITNEDGSTSEDFGLLQAIAPMPVELEDTTSPSDEPNWYDWRVSNWGTKWDVGNEGLEFIDNGDGTASITGWFDSAWAPPIGAYEKLSDAMDGVDIEASYYEPGMDFAGFWSTENGDEFCDDLHGEYNLPEDERSGLFQRLDEEYDLSYQFAEWDDFVEMED